MTKKDTAGSSESSLFEGREDFIQIFKRGAEFYEDLLKENEKLRYQLAKSKQDLDLINKGVEQGGFVAALQEQVKKLEDERQNLLQKYEDVEAHNKEFQKRYGEIEEEHNTLANLYIASYQLHSTLNFKEVSRIILEIAINLIGIGRLVLYLYDSEQQKLFPIAGDGLGENFDITKMQAIAKGEGPVGKVLEQSEAFVSDHPDQQTDLVAALPLKAGEKCVGVLSLERMLQQKSEWSQVDYELFTLLSAHAGTALMASALNEAYKENALSEQRLRAMMSEAE